MHSCYLLPHDSYCKYHDEDVEDHDFLLLGRYCLQCCCCCCSVLLPPLLRRKRQILLLRAWSSKPRNARPLSSETWKSEVLFAAPRLNIPRQSSRLQSSKNWKGRLRAWGLGRLPGALGGLACKWAWERSTLSQNGCTSRAVEHCLISLPPQRQGMAW